MLPLCKAAFPHGLMTGPSMQKTRVVFPALSIQCSPLRPPHTQTHLGWLACKLFGARLIPSCALAERSTQVCASCLPAGAGKGNMPRPHQATSALMALPENQLLAIWFCMVPAKMSLCNSSVLKHRVSHAPWPS